jgi:hypothetical protein
MDKETPSRNLLAAAVGVGLTAIMIALCLDHIRSSTQFAGFEQELSTLLQQESLILPRQLALG